MKKKDLERKMQNYQTSKEDFFKWSFFYIFAFYLFLIGLGGINLKSYGIPFSIGGSLKKIVIFPLLLAVLYSFFNFKNFLKQYAVPLLTATTLLAWVLLTNKFHTPYKSDNQFLIYFITGIISFILTLRAFSCKQQFLTLFLVLIIGISSSILKAEFDIIFTANKQFGLDSSDSIRLFTPIGHPNFLGAFMVLLLPYFIPTWNYIKKDKTHILLFFTTLTISFSGLIFSYSRTAWIASFITIILLGYIYSNKKRLIIILTLILLNILLLLNHDSFKYKGENPILKRASSLTSIKNDPNLLERIFCWKSSIEIAKDNLLTGIGAGNNRFEDKFKIYKQPQARLLMPHPHNVFLHILTSFGLPGLILFLMITSIGIFKSIRTWKSTKNLQLKSFHTGALLAVTGFLIYSCFDSAILAERVSPMIWMTIASLYYKG